MIKFENYKMVKEMLDKKLNQREFNDILKQLGVMDKKGNVYLLHMNKRIDEFLSKDDNKKAFLKELGDLDIKGSKVKIKAKNLKPGQTNIFLDKVLKIISEKPKFVKKVIKKGVINKTDDFLISSDNYIIDGHHRWCAAFILNPKCKIKCTQINLPIEVALPILNAMIKGDTESRNQDQSGNENFNIYKIIKDELPNMISDTIDRMNEDEKTKLFELIDRIDKKGDPIQYLEKNIKKLPKPDDEFTERKEMPQIKDNVDEVIDDIKE
jgi:hypothetical protein